MLTIATLSAVGCSGSWDIPDEFDRAFQARETETPSVTTAFATVDASGELSLDSELPDDEAAAIIVPVVMYYLDRYFQDVSDKTPTDLAIASILDESPESRGLFQRAVENYKAIPEETKYHLFDPDAVGWTSATDVRLDLDLIRNRLNLLESRAGSSSGGPPAAPSGLVAKNISQFEGPGGAATYQIKLTWQDNSNDEDGFLIYGWDYYTLAGAPPTLIGQVGPNVTTFVDDLTKPAVKDEQYCYEVVAFKANAIAPAGQLPGRQESTPSNTACSYYAPGYPPPPPAPDTDGDGVPDAQDKCPLEASNDWWAEGCQDQDADGYYDSIDDQCDLQWGEHPIYGDKGPMPPPGCPYKYQLRWMGMKILNNTGSYAYSQYTFLDKGKELYNEVFDDFLDYGEEPYLIFAFANGMTEYGMTQYGTTRWFCGERVDVKKGKDWEPDADTSLEEHPLKIKDLQAHGLTVFPSVPGKFAQIDRDLGLVLTLTLMERDNTITITPENEAATLEAAFKVGGAVAGAVAGCVSGPGSFGCLLSVGKAMKTVIEWIFDLGSKPTSYQVKDPDDYMGTDVWAITRSEAQQRTSGNGAYAFYFDTPTSYKASCLGVIPCSVKWTVPITMRARLYFCLYREGTPDSEIKKACSSYNMVLPWPQTASN